MNRIWCWLENYEKFCMEINSNELIADDLKKKFPIDPILNGQYRMYIGERYIAPNTDINELINNSSYETPVMLKKIQPIGKFILYILRLIILLIRLIILLIKEDSTVTSTSAQIFDPKYDTVSKILLTNNAISYSDLKKINTEFINIIARKKGTEKWIM
jgi:hypothetical protein